MKPKPKQAKDGTQKVTMTDAAVSNFVVSKCKSHPLQDEIFGDLGLAHKEQGARMLEIHPSLFLEGSPFLRPEWRWLKAAWLHKTSCRDEDIFSDDWVHAALKTHSGEYDSAAVKTVQIAKDIWTQPDHFQRWELEARLLTEQPFATIASKMELSFEVVEAYHEVFYAVRPRLKFRDWIMLSGIGGLLLEAIPEEEMPGAIWKFMAFKGGPFVLDAVLAVTNNKAFPADFFHSTGAQRKLDEVRLRLLVKAVLMLQLASDEEQIAEAVAIYEGLSQEEISNGTASQSASDRKDCVSIMARFLPNCHSTAESVEPESPNTASFANRSRGFSGGRHIKARKTTRLEDNDESKTISKTKTPGLRTTRQSYLKRKQRSDNPDATT